MGCRADRRGKWIVVRIHEGEPNLNFSTSRYLIDFITSISDASSGLAHLTVTPAWTRTLDNESNPTSIPQTNRHWSTMGANFRMAEVYRPSGKSFARYFFASCAGMAGRSEL